MIIKPQILKHDNGSVRIGVEIKGVVKNLKWVTDLNHSAGELIFDIANGKDLIIPAMGTIVDSVWDSEDIFWDSVLSAERASDTIVSVKAYDFERYLKSERSVVFQSGTLGDRYGSACYRLGALFHIKEQPTYRVPAEVCDGKTGFDMIKSAIDEIYFTTGEMYYITANHVYIELRRAPIPTKAPLVIDTQNTMADYTYSESVDSATNVAQVVQKNTDSSQTKTATATSDTGDGPTTTSFMIVSARGSTIRTWGQIVKVANAKNRASWAQMVQQANDGLKKRNVSERKLTLDCIGDTSLIASAGADIKIKDFSKTWTNYPILKATYNFGIGCTCCLEMEVGTKWQESSL